MEAQQRPIGYWVKQLDQLIEDGFAAALAEHRLARRHWQVLSVLRRSPTDQAGLTVALAPFWEGTGPALPDIRDDLRQRGWLVGDSGSLTLTAAGEQAHAAVTTRV